MMNMLGKFICHYWPRGRSRLSKPIITVVGKAAKKLELVYSGRLETPALGYSWRGCWLIDSKRVTWRVVD